MGLRTEDFPAHPPSGLPDVHSLASERLQCLWVLQVSKDSVGAAWLTPGEIERVLRDRYGVHIPRQRIPSLLGAPVGTVTRKRASGKYVYQVMKSGTNELAVSPTSVTFVDPAAALSHIREAETLFQNLRGVVRLCDPYVDGRTLDYLSHSSGAKDLRILTANISKPGPLRRDLAAFRAQYASPVELRQAPQGHIHDRYVIDDDTMLIFGTSLNSFARKQSFVIRAGEDVRASVVGAFDLMWQTSKVFS